jgi:hypothetical protein
VDELAALIRPAVRWENPDPGPRPLTDMEREGYIFVTEENALPDPPPGHQWCGAHGNPEVFLKFGRNKWLPIDYRPLIEGEEICKGDEFVMDGRRAKWRPFTSIGIGQSCRCSIAVTRTRRTVPKKFLGGG